MSHDSPLLIRADAGVRMGTGHVMRCLGLAQAWQDSGGRVTYAMAASSPGVVERLRGENIDVQSLTTGPGSAADAIDTAGLAANLHSDWIVLDGYHFDSDYQRLLKRSARRLLVLDDFGELPSYTADIVLNQDPIADERLYANRASETRLLLGTEYTFLRREFRLVPRTSRKFNSVARKLLVTMGGSDPDNVTEKVIQSLDGAAVEGLETIVLVGPSNPHGSSLEKAANACRTKVRLLHNPPDIPNLMAECDMAIVAGGSTLWELAYFYVPSIVLVLADNQETATALLHEQGACWRLGTGREASTGKLSAAITSLCRDATARANLGAALGATTDGRGAERVCAAMRCADFGRAAQPAARANTRGRA
jgi:UDP-2,4-diacetamido-2,4,6-trideoxy-beta-L-altropyranose hydrolase